MRIFLGFQSGDEMYFDCKDLEKLLMITDEEILQANKSHRIKTLVVSNCKPNQ